MKMYLVFTKKNYENLNLIRDITPVDIYYRYSEESYMPYAYTDDKKMIKDFLDIHKEYLFSVNEVKIDKEEISDIINDGFKELIYREIRFNNLSLSLPVTKTEMDYIGGYFRESFFDILYDITEISPEIFNDKYIDELEKLGYTYDHYSCHGSEEMREMIDYNAGYYPTNSLSELTKDCSELFQYLIMFKDVIDKNRMLSKFILESRSKL